MSIPIVDLKSVSPSEIRSVSLFEPSQKMSMSSTKSRCVIVSPIEIFIPEKRSPTLAFDKNRLKHSATRRKSRWERGKPCRSPLPAWKNPVVEPLSRMEKETKFKHAIIQLTNPSPKPKWIRSILMYNQLTLSKGLDRSILITAALSFFNLMLCRPSWATSIA